MYKFLNEQSAPSLGEKFIKIKDLNTEYNLRSNYTDLALPKPKTNYLKRSFKYSDAMLWNSLLFNSKAFFNTMGHLPHWVPSSAPPLKKKMAYCPKVRALGPVLSK